MVKRLNLPMCLGQLFRHTTRWRNNMKKMSVIVSVCCLWALAYSEWLLVPNVDPMTDADRSHIMCLSNNEEGAIAFKNFEEGLGFLIYFGKFYVGKNDKVVVRWRFDSEEPSELSAWTLGPENNIAVAPPKDTKLILSKIGTAKRIVVQVTDADLEQVVQVFDLTEDREKLSSFVRKYR